MQHLPAPAAHLPNCPCCRSHCQRNHQRKSHQTNGDEPPLGNVLQHVMHHKILIEPKIGKQVQCSIKKSKQPQHPPESNQPILLRRSEEHTSELQSRLH